MPNHMLFGNINVNIITELSYNNFVCFYYLILLYLIKSI